MPLPQNSEQIIFQSPQLINEKGPEYGVVQLLVNPETLTLTWKKVINRVRTKTRLVTLFWGEEPVKFTYRGQTGYVYPSFSDREGVLKKENAENLTILSNATTILDKLEVEIVHGGPYTYETAAGNLQNITALRNVIKNINSNLLVPRGGLLANLNTKFNNTQILWLSEKYKILKKLELFYRKHQNPDDALMQVIYRDYTFKGYFESFSYTDDARNPWNWIYTIDFTILDWKENIEKKLEMDGEIVLIQAGENIKAEYSTLEEGKTLSNIDAEGIVFGPTG